MSINREVALEELRLWATPGRRAALIAQAWLAGVTNVRALAEAAGVTRQTVYNDLDEHGIDPAADRPRKESPMFEPITVNGYTGNEPQHVQHWLKIFSQKFPELMTSAKADQDGRPFFDWFMKEFANVQAAKFHNELAPFADEAAACRQAAQRHLRRVETAWTALQTAERWHAAHHAYVEAVHDAREAINAWQGAATALADAIARQDSRCREAYEELVLDGPSLRPDTDAAALALMEVEETHRRRRAIAAETLGLDRG